jgi:hypothetical protein
MIHGATFDVTNIVIGKIRRQNRALSGISLVLAPPSLETQKSARPV